MKSINDSRKTTWQSRTVSLLVFMLLLVGMPLQSVASTLSFSTNFIDFGQVQNCATANRTVTLTNTDVGDITITDIQFTFNQQDAFKVSWSKNLPATLLPGESMDVTLSYHPTDISFQLADLQITNTSTNAPNLIVSAMGLAKECQTFSVTKPATGESVPTGEPYTIIWTPQIGAASYMVKLSIDGGETWPEKLGAGLSDTTMIWNVPTTIKKNITNAMVKVVAKNNNNIKLGVAKSDKFSIDVLSITAPAAAEVVFQSSTYNITWTANGMVVSPEQVVVQYRLNNWLRWKNAQGTLGASSFSWTVPAVSKTKNKAQVRVMLKAAGKTVAKAISSKFTIQ